jgi:hypothetical protein
MTMPVVVRFSVPLVLVGGGVLGLFPRDRWQRITPDGSAGRFTHHSLPAGGRGVGLAFGF